MNTPVGIHVKTLLIFALAVVLLFGLIIALASSVVLRQFTEIEEGQRAIRLFLVCLALAGGLLFFLIWYLLDWAVLSRIKELGHRLDEARTRGELPVHLGFKGRDELADLARRFEQLATSQQEAHEQLRRLSGRLLQLQDEERRRIARELHDSTAQNLTALGMNLSLVENTLRSGRGDPLVFAREARDLADQCSREIRTISYLLHPPLLDEVGLAFALQWYAEGFASRTGIHVDLAVPDDIGRLSKEIETTLFRVVQEALTNVHRHAGGRHASIGLQQRDGRLILEVSDKGRGMTSAQLAALEQEPGTLGVGLPGMRERLRQLDGSLAIWSGATGTVIRATVPLPPTHGHTQSTIVDC